MKQTSKEKVIAESIRVKLDSARKLKYEGKVQQAIELYRKVIFLKEEPQTISQLADTYQKLNDLSTALNLYHRLYQIKPKHQIKEKVKSISKIQGMQLLFNGSFKNILQQSEFIIFKDRYHSFHQKLNDKAKWNQKISEHLLSCLAFLQVNCRQYAIDQIDNCLIIEEKDIDLKIMKGMILWSMMEIQKGYQQFWQAYILDKNNQDVKCFLEIIIPKIDSLYKEAKYDLIDKKIEKCRVKVKKGLQMHPYHTNFLILSSYLNRTNQKFENAIVDLELAKQTLEDTSLEVELKQQFSLTYNEMGVYLYKQGKYYQAIDLFTEALKYKEKDWAVYANRGDCFKQIQDYPKALEDYQIAFKLEKSDDIRLRIVSINHLQEKNQINFNKHN